MFWREISFLLTHRIKRKPVADNQVVFLNYMSSGPTPEAVVRQEEHFVPQTEGSNVLMF